MNNVISLSFEGSPVRFNADVWIDAASAAKRFGKKPAAWLRSIETLEYLSALAEALFGKGVSETQLGELRSLDSRGKGVTKELLSDSMIKGKNQTSGIKSIASSQEGSGGLRRTQDLPGGLTGYEKWSHGQSLYVLQRHEVDGYHAITPDKCADKEKPRRLRRRGLFGKDAPTSSAYQSGQHTAPRGEAFETASMLVPVRLKEPDRYYGRTVLPEGRLRNTGWTCSSAFSDGLSPIDLFSGAGGITERSPRFFQFLERSTMAQIADSNTDAPNLPVPGARATAAQLCAKYQVSRATWWRWSKTPGFPKPLRFGRSVRWDPEPVDAFLIAHGDASETGGVQ